MVKFITSVESIGTGGHGLDDTPLSANLLGEIIGEAMGQPWFAVVLRSNGQIVKKASSKIAIPTSEKQRFLVNLVVQANKQIHHQGAWVGTWFGCKRFAVWWKDPDGDRPFFIDNEEPWVRVRKAPLEHWLEEFDTAWRYMWLQVNDGDIGKAEKSLVARELGQKYGTNLIN